MLGRLRAALVRSGAEVTTARSGWEMLALLSQRRVDLVVSDLRTPEPSGIQVVSLARRLGFKVPFLVVTDSSDPGLRQRAATIGATVLERPRSDDDLVRAALALAPGAA